MTGSRLSWLAALAFATMVVGCGSTSTAAAHSATSTPSGISTQQPSQGGNSLSAQVTVSGGVNGTLDVDTAASQCALFPSGLFSATFDGVLPGTEAAFSVLSPVGVSPLIAGDAVTLDGSTDSWNNDISGTITITVAGKTATGSVTVEMGGYAVGSSTAPDPANLHVAASFRCTV